MSGDVQLLLLIVGVHMFGLVCVAVLMLPALRDADDIPPGPQGNDSDDGWGRGPRKPPVAPSSSPRGGLPLPDAIPARVRLREHGSLRERLPGRERRPAHEPVREPTRLPA